MNEDLDQRHIDEEAFKKEVYKHAVAGESYKGWETTECGSGKLVFEKNDTQIIASRHMSVKNWIDECWVEIKTKIDEIEG
ncbi:hypothetical protein [Paenibacillus spongiae]|uniref:Uncharacterized protein n=1 Tax=Paenibacillus spongiae TaxID=2909671 RepID=A0ABY5SDR6_9BACL|nr:hypothetical protein [Paenibacillus spongiae]UVI32107.1 hypothetical protein L1F29_09920 [Paenibacillus spongiae]